MIVAGIVSLQHYIPDCNQNCSSLKIQGSSRRKQTLTWPLYPKR